MRPAVWLLILSLAANALLAASWLRSRKHPARASASDAPPAALAAPGSTAAPRPAAPAVQTAPERSSAPTVETPAGVRSWEDLQRDDLKEFIRRLRAAACPEETIQDLILAEVNRRFAARQRELWPENSRPYEFWKVNKQNPEETRKNRERMRAQRQLWHEKSALLVELLGVDVEKERRKADGISEGWDYYDSRVSYLPADKREAVQKYLEEFEDQQFALHERNRGMWDAQARAEQRQLEAERLQGLAQWLTPAELREFELRQSQLASQLTHDLRALPLNREQYEAIFDIRKKYGESIYNYGDDEDMKTAHERAEKTKKSMQAELAAALGPEKALEYKRAQDYQYQELARLAKRHDLPTDTAAKVYDFKEAAEDAVKQLKADTTLTDERRQEALNKIRDETQQAVQTALGGAHYTNYLRQGGWWINQLAPRPPSPASRARPAAP
jgi:hypothetical protein